MLAGSWRLSGARSSAGRVGRRLPSAILSPLNRSHWRDLIGGTAAALERLSWPRRIVTPAVSVGLTLSVKISSSTAFILRQWAMARWIAPTFRAQRTLQTYTFDGTVGSQKPR